MTTTGRAESKPEMQQLPGSLEKQVLALAAENANLRAENAHLKNALALADALRNKERKLPL